MHIALVSTPFVSVPPPGYGGTELVVHELARGLSAVGHDVTLFATGDSHGRDVRAVFDRPVWPPDARAEQLHCEFVARAVARERFDLVHAHLPGMLTRPALGAPLVYTLHHAQDPALTAIYRQRPDVRYVAISARQASLEPDLRCDVIHHGLDPDLHPLGHGEGGYAAFLGRMAPCKGPDLAIAAAAAAGIPIRLAGRVHEADVTPDWLGTMRTALARPAVTHFEGVAGQRKVRFLGSARALLMPSRWEEPFGLVMAEAMLCGTPVIAFARGAALELVEEGVTGYLVEDEEEMGIALLRVDRIDRLSCRRRAQKRFSSDRMVREYVRVYARALDRTRFAEGRAGGAPEVGTYAG